MDGAEAGRLPHQGEGTQGNLLHGAVLFGDLKDVIPQGIHIQHRIFGLLDDYVRGNAVQLQSGGGGVVRQGGGQLHIDLRHGQAVLHGGVAVDGNVEGRGSVLQSVGNLRHAGDVCQRLANLCGGGLEGVHVVAVDVYRNAAAGEHTHIHHGGRGRHLAGQIRAGFLDLLAHRRAAGRVVGESDINRYVVGFSASHAQHGGAAAHHRAHGLDAVNFRYSVQHLIGKRGGLGHVRILGHGEGNVHAGHIHVRHEDEALGKTPQRRDHQQRCRNNQNHGLMPQRPLNRLAVGGKQMLFQKPRLDLVLPAQHPRRHGRHQCQGNDQACQQGIGHGERQIGKQLLGDTRDEHDGQEHADGGQGRGRHRPRHLSCAGDGGLNDVGPLGPQAVNILDDHHGVIHQHTHRHGKAGQGDHVDGHAGEVHQHDGKDHADGDGAKGDKGWAQIPQEQEQDQDREHRTQQEAIQNGINDQIDIVALTHQGHEA